MRYDHNSLHTERVISEAVLKYSKQQIKRIGKRLRKRNTPEMVAKLAGAQTLYAADKKVARTIHLAHMFLKGTPMAKVEDPRKTRTVIPFDEVAAVAVAASFIDETSEQEIVQRCASWYDEWHEKRALR